MAIKNCAKCGSLDQKISGPENLWTRRDISPSPKSLLINGWTYIIGGVCVCGYHRV